MATREFKVEDVEAALLAQLTACFSGFESRVNVQALSGEDIDADGALIVVPPAALLLFDAESQEPAADSMAIRYEPSQLWLVLCGARNLRTPGQERSQALALVSAVKSYFAGRRLSVPGSEDPRTAPIELAGVERFQYDKEGSWYAVRLVVRDMAVYEVKA